MCRSSERPMLDLLVIGAGPAGLSVAVAAKNRGARRVLVVEQARALREVGQGIDLLPNAVRAFHTFSPAVRENLKPYIREPPPNNISATILEPSGNILQQITYPVGFQRASTQWWEIQRLLIDSMPGTGFLLVNHKLVDLEHHCDYATAHFVMGKAAENPFKNWQENDVRDNIAVGDFLLSPQDALEEYFDVIGERDNKNVMACRAKVVVAADGINSVARTCIYRDSSGGWEKFSKPVYSGYVSLFVFGIPETSTDFSEEDLREVHAKYLDHSRIAPIACSRKSPWPMRLNLFHERSNSLVAMIITVLADEDAFDKNSKSSSELAQMGLDMALEMGVSPALERLFHALARKRPIRMWPFYVVPATHPPPYKPRSFLKKVDYPEGFDRPWYHRRIVLVGDAAHAAPNFKAQGTAMAAEDALNLTTRLQAAGVWDANCADVSEEKLTEVFEQYRLARLKRVRAHQEWTMNGPSEYDVERQKRISEFFTSFDPADIEGIRVVT